jgi:hypothetical protein
MRTTLPLLRPLVLALALPLTILALVATLGPDRPAPSAPAAEPPAAPRGP